ncbi:MAG: hotdog fold thioesterase [Candidatus Hydrogenedentes bacterium]|nr:hotdog fold thioesterase [Candidatus Hydrogenedentota bacterium]
MPIWNAKHSLAQLNAMAVDTIHEPLGIQFIEIGDDYVRATMPVDKRTYQPAGLLHGGASVVLAESLGSMASYMVVDATKVRCVGIEVNANHIRSATSGTVTGTVRPIHIGKSTHVWEIRIADEAEKLVCVCRLTTAVLPVAAG